MDAVLNYLARHETRFVDELCHYVRFRSVSAQPEHRADMTADEIVAMEELAFAGVTSIIFVFLLLAFGEFHFLPPLALGALAGMTPGYLVHQKAIERRIRINRQLPFALDLLILSMEAGSAFLESIEILVSSNPTSPLAQEFYLVLQSIQHGRTRRVALEEMDVRVDSEDLRPVVHGINTGEELGTPIGSVLRVQAEGIRMKRSQRAEKLAAEASSKILFPTLLIMVAVLLMLMGPVIIKGVRDGWF